MPTYDYVCDSCENAFEHFQSMKDEVLKKCPKCKKNKLRRLIGAGAAVVFRGSGFYQTDYRSESYKKGAAADKPASESKPSEGKTSESKTSSQGPSSSKGDSKSKSSES